MDTQRVVGAILFAVAFVCMLVAMGLAAYLVATRTSANGGGGGPVSISTKVQSRSGGGGGGNGGVELAATAAAAPVPALAPATAIPEVDAKTVQAWSQDPSQPALVVVVSDACGFCKLFKGTLGAMRAEGGGGGGALPARTAYVKASPQAEAVLGPVRGVPASFLVGGPTGTKQKLEGAVPAQKLREWIAAAAAAHHA